MLNWYTAYNSTTGQIVSVFNDDGNTVVQNTPANTLLVEGAFDLEGYIDIASKEFVPMPAKPDSISVFNWTTKLWEDPRSLEDLKNEQWEYIKQIRTQKEQAGFTWNNNIFDSDIVSQQKILGAAQLATLDPNYVVDWTLQNNSVITLNAEQVIEVGRALGEHLTQLHLISQQLRQQIDAATNKQQVEAVIWPSS